MSAAEHGQHPSYSLLQVLNNIEMDGIIVIGEGEKDEVLQAAICLHESTMPGQSRRCILCAHVDRLLMLPGTHALLR